MKDLKERTLRSGFSKVIAQVANFVLRLGSLMVLARLLDPKDFGLVGMVTAITGVFSLFKDAGLSMVTVQRSTISNEQISTLFWINLLVGAILGVFSLAIAPLLASFYHEPRLFWVTVVLASGFILNAAGVQHSALLQRQMRFTTLALIDIVSLVFSIGVGIGMAMSGFKYWSLVGSALILPAISTICLWWATEWVPGLPRRKVGVRSMMLFGGMVTLNGLVMYVAYNIEKVLLGRYWGAMALGIYDRAYQLINIPTANLNSAIGGVTFSVLSRLQDEPVRLKSYFLKGYSLVLALTLPITIACGLFADEIISIFLGSKWNSAVIIFRLLTPTILIFALINPFSWFLYSIGLAKRSLNMALVIAPLMIVAYLIGLPYGPKGMALSYSAVLTLWVVPHIAWCIHGTMISTRDLLQTVGRPFLSALVAAFFAFVVNLFYGHSLPSFPRLILGGTVLLSSYLWMLWYVMGQKAFYMDLLRGMKRSVAPLPKESVNY